MPSKARPSKATRETPRTQNGVPPKTSRGIRTRAALLAAAREEFEAEGYAAANVLGITRRAGVSNGTFYFYFPSKESIFLEMIQHVLTDISESPRRVIQAPRVQRGTAVAERIARVHKIYIDNFIENSRFIRLVEEAANLNETVRKLRRDIRRTQIGVAARDFASMQKAGLIDPEIDVAVMAEVLGSMVYNAAYVIAFLDEDADREAIEACLTLVEVRALKLKRGRPRTTAATG